MRIIAYKIADNSLLKDSLPAGWITEYTFIDEHPDDLLKSDDGWLFIADDKFTALFESSNNEDKLEQQKVEQQAIQTAHTADLEIKAKKFRDDQIAVNAEFEAFKAWKTSK